MKSSVNYVLRQTADSTTSSIKEFRSSHCFNGCIPYQIWQAGKFFPFFCCFDSFRFKI